MQEFGASENFSEYDTEHYESGYFPEENVRRHDGTIITDNTEFFAAPPPEIGNLLTADSTLKTTDEPFSFSTKLGLILGAGIAGYVLIVVLGGWIFPKEPGAAKLLGLLIGGIGALIAWLYGRFDQTVSYVGEHGIATYKIVGSRDSELTEKIMPFGNAVAVFQGIVDQYTNGVYTGSNFTKWWEDESGSSLETLKGSYRNGKPSSMESYPYHFAESAVHAWNAYYTPVLMEQINTMGYAQFPIGRANSGTYIRIHGEGIEHEKKGNVKMLSWPEISDITANDGMFHIQSVNSTWFSGKGFKISASEFGNLDLFLMLLQSLSEMEE